jgi:hypothetical protein
MSALQMTSVPAKRWRWICLAASTRACTTLDFSPRRLSLSFSYSTRGAWMWMSMRSSSGPEIRFWYLVTVSAEQV